MEVIQEKEAFYGYIIGLQVERQPDTASGDIGTKLYATFEYSGVTKVWEVPDAELFKILAEYLVGMAESRSNGEFGYCKLWICHKDGQWHVGLP